MCTFTRLDGGVMGAQNRGKIGFLLAALVLVAGVGLLVLSQDGSGAVRADTPTQLASVSVPAQPNSLAWSADGRYLAAGTWGRGDTWETATYEVYVVDVGQASVVSTLKMNSAVEGLAFSPDGKWLAVATRPPDVPDSATKHAELVVFDVPALAARFSAQVGNPANGFIELAWAADSKSLLAIDGPANNILAKAEIRRWVVPRFTEQPVVRAFELKGEAALAVSPGGRTLALSYGDGTVQKSLVQVLGQGKQGEQALRSGGPFRSPRLGFTADGQAVGVFDTQQMLWWDVATGRRVEPGATHFAVQPAGLSGFRSRSTVSPDGGWIAWGYERHPGLGHLSLIDDDKRYGGFVKLTHIASGKSRTWRVSRAQYPPAVAFSPDGTKLAGTIRLPIQPGSKPGSDAGAILIWAVPK
jgi:hypothetical protein